MFFMPWVCNAPPPKKPTAQRSCRGLYLPLFAVGEYPAEHDAEEEIKDQNKKQPPTLHAHRRDEFSLNEAEEDRRRQEGAQKRNAYDLVLSLLFRQGILTLSAR